MVERDRYRRVRGNIRDEGDDSELMIIRNTKPDLVKRKSKEYGKDELI